MKNTKLSNNLASPSEAALSHLSELDGLHLSPHFTLAEFCKPPGLAMNLGDCL